MDQVGNDFKEQDYIGKEFIGQKFVDSKRILSYDNSYINYIGEVGIIEGFHTSHYPSYVRVKFKQGVIHFPLEAIQDQFKANLEKETPEYLQKLYIDVFKITRKICIKKKR